MNLLCACAALATLACGGGGGGSGGGTAPAAASPSTSTPSTTPTTGSGGSTTTTPPAPAPMQTATVRFLPSTSAGVLGYSLVVATSSGGYSSGTQVDIPVGSARVAAGGVLEYDVQMTANVPHYLAMRAYSAQAISGFSNEIVIPAVAAAATSSTSTAMVGESSGTTSGSTSTGTSGGSTPASTSGSGTSTASAPASSTSTTSTTTTSTTTASTSALNSLDLDGAGEYLASSAAYALGVSDQFTLSLWALADPQASGSRALVSVRGGAQTTQNRIELRADATDLQMTVYNDAGQLVYQAVYGAALVPGSWQHIGLTFDAQVDSAPVLFVDGLVRAPAGANLTGQPPVFSDSAGHVFLGGSSAGGAGTWFGALGHAALWSVALGDDEIDEISLRGHSLDLRQDAGAYLGSDALLHYWRLGENPAAVGHDSGSASTPIDLDDPAGNVDGTDIVPDAPTLLP